MEPDPGTGIEIGAAVDADAARVVVLDAVGVDRHPFGLQRRHHADLVGIEQAGGADILAIGETDGNEGQVRQVPDLADELALQVIRTAGVQAPGAERLGIALGDVRRRGEKRSRCAAMRTPTSAAICRWNCSSDSCPDR